jgi:hypothetical protein
VQQHPKIVGIFLSAASNVTAGYVITFHFYTLWFFLPHNSWMNELRRDEEEEEEEEAWFMTDSWHFEVKCSIEFCAILATLFI